MISKERAFLPNVSILLKTALPLMLTNLIQTLYNLTDSYFLGKLGREYVSAPIIAFQITYFLIAFGMSFGMGGTTLISQSKGKGSTDKMNLYLGQTATMLALITIVLVIVGISAINPLLAVLQTPVELQGYVSQYLLVFFMGLPFMFALFLFSSGMQGRGDTMTPLVIQIITVLINVILDPLLIFGIGIFPRLEVLGAAIATVIARAIAAVIGIYLLFRGTDGYRLRLKEMVPRKRELFQLIKISLPISLGQSTSALGFAVMQGVVNHFGVAVIAAFGIGNRIIALFNMPCMGFGRAVSILVGQRLGAKEPDEAKAIVKAGFISTLVFIVPSMLFIFFFGSNIIELFVSDSETIMWGGRLFRTVSLSVILFGLIMVFHGAFTGAGDTKPIMFFNILRLWGLRVPLAYILAILIKQGPDGLWNAMLLSNIVVIALSWFWYKRDRWTLAVDVDGI